MGAELWVSEIVWMGSAEASLGELHRQLLEPEVLRSILPDADTLLQLSYELLDMLPYLPEEVVPEGTVELMNSAIANIESTGLPSGRDEVLAVMAQAGGTSSALDVDGIVGNETGGQSSLLASPVPDDEQMTLWGTTAPSLALVLGNSQWHPNERSARFVIAHDDDGPIHAVFAGVSGD